MSCQDRRTVILGIGNLLMRDDGVGVHVVQALRRNPPQLPHATLEIWDAGTSPDVAFLVAGADRVIIIDAVQQGEKPGTIYCFLPEDIAWENRSPLSLHQRGLGQSLAEMTSLSSHPSKTVIVGVEPKEISPSVELSTEIEARIPRIIEVIMEQLKAP